MCLEELLGRPVPKGAIFHQQSRRRREMVVDTALRETVETAAREVRRLLTEKKLPPPVDDSRRCPECSLHDICQPDLARANAKLVVLHEALFIPDDVP